MNGIQSELKQQLHLLSKAGISPSHVLFKNVASNQRADQELGERAMIKEDRWYRHGSSRGRIRSTAAPTTIMVIRGSVENNKGSEKEKKKKNIKGSREPRSMMKRTPSTMLHA